MNDCRFLIVGDFHGKIPKIKKNHLDFDAILCTGDFPYSNDIRDIIFKNWDKFNEGKKLHELIGRKKYDSIYSRALESQEPILKWLDSFNKPVFLVYGNHDYDSSTIKSVKYFENFPSLNALCKKFKSIHLIKNRAIDFKGIKILAFGDSFSRHHKTKEFKKIWNKRLSELFKKRDKKKLNIFLTHDPPKGALDKIRDKKSPAFGKHYGDDIFPKYLKKYRPQIMACGHMHENQGKKKLFDTLVINSGYGHDNHYAYLKINEKKIKKLEFE